MLNSELTISIRLASVEMCLKSIERLDAKPLLIQLPIRDEKSQFIGVVDLITMEKMTWLRDAESDRLLNTMNMSLCALAFKVIHDKMLGKNDELKK